MALIFIAICSDGFYYPEHVRFHDKTTKELFRLKRELENPKLNSRDRKKIEEHFKADEETKG